MEPELFGPTAAISAQHFCKGSQRGARTAISEKLRIINQFSGAFLELIHQRILFIRIERLVEATQIQQSLAARNEIAKNEFLAVEDISNINDGKLRYETFVKAYNETREHGGINGLHQKCFCKD